VHWRTRGPEGHVVTYGVDPKCGSWAAVDGGARCYASASLDLDAAVISILVYMSQYELFGADDIYDAVAWLRGGEGLPGWPGRRRRAPRRLRRVLRVIGRLAEAGG